MQSYDEFGKKKVGGDEYYVSIRVSGRDVAVAHVSDQHDGSYALLYQRVELPLDPTTSEHASLHVVLQYTCGGGRLDPPLKDRMPTSGAVNALLLVRRATHAPPLIQYVPPTPAQPEVEVAKIDLSSFDAIVAIGDSTMRQFRPRDAVASRMALPMGFHQLSFVITPESASRCAQSARFARSAYGGGGASRQLVLFGGGTWDVMTEYGGGAATLSLHAYAAAFVHCLRGVRQAFPNGTLVLKSLSALHPHRVACDTYASQLYVNTQRLKNRSAACHERVRYMSESRAAAIYHLQEALAASEGVHTLSAMYPLTYRHALRTPEGDGRHFTPQFNDFMWRHFFRAPRLCPKRQERLSSNDPAAADEVAGQAECSVKLLEQHSQARCLNGVSFGCRVAPDGLRVVWVRNCRGVFRCDGEMDDVPCGYPPGVSRSYVCECRARTGGSAGFTRGSCERQQRFKGPWNLVGS